MRSPVYPIGMVRLSPAASAPVHRGWIPGEHRGEDRNARGGRTIRAAAPGVVESVQDGGGWNGGWGNRTTIRHTPRAVTTYNHWETGSSLVAPGQSVGDQQDICTMGLTGDTDGYHVHFELYIDGERVDPAYYYDHDLPGSDGSGSGGIPAPSGWVVGTTIYQGATGAIPLDAGALVYAAGPGDYETGIAAAYGLSWEQLKAQTEKLGASKWAAQILTAGQSIHIFGQTVYQGQIFALNDVVALLDANEAAALAAQQAAVEASIIPVPAVATPDLTNKGLFAPPVSAAEPEQKSEPVVGSVEEAPRRAYTAEELASVVASALEAFTKGGESAPASEAPIIADKVAKPLWVVFAAIGVSAGPVAQFAVLLWGADIDVATQLAVTVTGWTGSLAAILGLSRFAKTK